ncbi:MAG: type II and III secretion system protein [Robiginitomaculum sp.]|nr:MAG: type II and III secretion system protein [Robiginitomaculum sp.]
MSVPSALRRLTALALLVTGLAYAPLTHAGEAALRHVKVDIGGNGLVSQSLDLPLNKAAVIELPIDARDVLVSNPEIVDAVIRTPRRIYILGMKQGQANAFFFDANGNQILNLEITVAQDVRRLSRTIAALLPRARVKIQPMGDNLILSGTVPDAGTADSVLKIAQQSVEKPENVLSLLTIQGKSQVLLKVRVVEMQRTLVKQLGINLSGSISFGNFLAPIAKPLLENGVPVLDQFGNAIFETVIPGSFGTTAGLATNNAFSLAGRPLGGTTGSIGYKNFRQGVQRSSIGAGISALERVGLVRTLAEPNLTAITGESANFLAGGEFPVPVGRDRDGNIQIEYKKFGVGLGFTPLVVSKGRISLKISTEVSELTTQGALQLGSQAVTDANGNVIGTVEGLTLPALKVRRAETTVELPSGGSMVIAGLIQEKTKQALEGVPGAKDLPILGALFRSRDYQNDETELVIVVTPYLVDPTHPDALSTPADGFSNASDLGGLLFGRLNKVYRAPGTKADGKTWNGPIGYVLE